MAILFKCKMCGGALSVDENMSVGVCQYCGTEQTLPKLSNEKRIQLYDRANHYRRNNDFDKAAGIYEQILLEDNTDAEAYWSLILCRFGIEYVEDPISHKRLPTVNRTQFTSIYNDDNYKSAIEYADTQQRYIYEEEAKNINEIQKGILSISKEEPPFDIFICYKESDSNGRRTRDSVLATDLYHQLTKEGFKVFFARITLEDKLGTAYEPYIFAALNSSKVMVVLGTQQEYFNAVWVKNEWSRYLALIRCGAEKILIPAYRDMDPYELPEEFSHLQAQDMSKLGFMQDLIHGIKKIIKSDAVESFFESEKYSGDEIKNYIKRIFMFLEDKDFASADKYCEKVLDMDPENADAYLGKLMVQLKVPTKAQIKDSNIPFSDNINYKKVCRFGKTLLIKELEEYNNLIIERINDAHYTSAVSKMNSAKNCDDYNFAAASFAECTGYKDAEMLREACLAQAEISRQKETEKETIYNSANEKKGCALQDISKWEEVLNEFKKIPDWKDADEQVIYCQQKIEQLRRQEAESIQRAKQSIELIKKEMKIPFFKLSVLAVMAILSILLPFILAPTLIGMVTPSSIILCISISFVFAFRGLFVVSNIQPLRKRLEQTEAYTSKTGIKGFFYKKTEYIIIAIPFFVSIVTLIVILFYSYS